MGYVPLGGLQYNMDLGVFVEGVRAVTKALRTEKEKVSDGDTGLWMVIVLVCMEDLRVKELIVPLVWLAELSGESMMTLFISEVLWFDTHPRLMVAPDPFLINIPILSKQGRHITSHPYVLDKHHLHQTRCK